MYIQQYNYSSVPSSDSTRSGLFKFTHRGSNLYLIRTMRNNGNTFYETSDHRVKTTTIDPVDINNPMSAHWKLEKSDDGYFYLRAYGSSEYLSTYDYNSNNISTKYCVTQTKNAAGDHAKWLMIKYTGQEISGAAFYNRSDNPSSVYMESSTQLHAYMWSTDMNNHGMIIWGVHNNIKWTYPCYSTISSTGVLQTYAFKEAVDVSVSTTGSVTHFIKVDVKQPLETGLYAIKSNFSKTYMKIDRNTYLANAKLIQHDYGHEPETKSERGGIFKVEWTGDGNKYIIRTMTNNANGLTHPYSTAGSNIYTGAIVSTTNHIWYITRDNNTNIFRIRTSDTSSSTAVAVKEGAYSPGATDADRFLLELVDHNNPRGKWIFESLEDINSFSGCSVSYYYPYILNNNSNIPMRFDDLKIMSFYSTDLSINTPGDPVSITVKSLANQNSIVAYKSGSYIYPYNNSAGMVSVIAKYQNATADPINIYVKPTTNEFFFLQNIQSTNGFVKSFGTNAQKTSFGYDDRQIWKRIDAGDGYYFIQNMDGCYLTAPNSSSTNKPILLSSSLLTGTDAKRQKWLFEPAPSGSGGVRIRSANITNRYLNIKSSNGVLIQDTYVKNNSYYDEFNVVAMGDDVVYLRTLEGFSDLDPSELIKNLSLHYDSFTIMNMRNHLGMITDKSDPKANTNVAKELLENSKVAIFNGHGSWSVITIHDGEQYYLRNTDVYKSANNHMDLSNVDIVFFAGCSTADDTPLGQTGYNITKSAELSGAKVAIGWGVTQYGDEMMDWINTFFEFMNQIDPSTGQKFTALRAFNMTNAAYDSVVSEAKIYGTNKYFRFE